MQQLTTLTLPLLFPVDAISKTRRKQDRARVRCSARSQSRCCSAPHASLVSLSLSLTLLFRLQAAKKLAANTKAPKVSASSLKAKQEADAEKMRAKNVSVEQRASRRAQDRVAHRSSYRLPHWNGNQKRKQTRWQPNWLWQRAPASDRGVASEDAVWPSCIERGTGFCLRTLLL